MHSSPSFFLVDEYKKAIIDGEDFERVKNLHSVSAFCSQCNTITAQREISLLKHRFSDLLVVTSECIECHTKNQLLTFQKEQETKILGPIR